MSKIIVVGGGIIGLSIAYELGTRGHNVVLLERDTLGNHASWAGCGMIPASNADSAIHPMEHLAALSLATHVKWSRRLLEQTGVDNGFRQCGGLYIARTPGETAALIGAMSDWTECGIPNEKIDGREIDRRFESFAGITERLNVIQSVWVPGESQFSNPDHLTALEIACRQMGIAVHEGQEVTDIKTDNQTIQSVVTRDSSFSGDQYFFTSGPWTQQLVESTAVTIPMHPVRGQMALYKIDPEIHRSIAMGPIVYEGGRYLVPRQDGHVLAGSTIENAGFDCKTTDSEISNLRNWAENLTPAIDESRYVRSWAGLRPATWDGFPYLGRLGQHRNAFVATGHFKSGLQLSTGTALVMADLAEGITPNIELGPLDPARVGRSGTGV